MFLYWGSHFDCSCQEKVFSLGFINRLISKRYKLSIYILVVYFLMIRVFEKSSFVGFIFFLALNFFPIHFIHFLDSFACEYKIICAALFIVSSFPFFEIPSFLV